MAAVLVAGHACGGSDEGSADEAPQPSAVEVWVDDLCSSVNDWQDTTADVRASLSDPAEVSAADLRSALHQIDDATSTLVADLKGSPVPETESGEQVQKQVSTLGDQLQEQAQVVEEALDRPPGTAEELLGQVSTATGALSQMAADTKGAITTIRESAGAADLGAAIERSASCQDLRDGR